MPCDYDHMKECEPAQTIAAIRAMEAMATNATMAITCRMFDLTLENIADAAFFSLL